MNARFFSCGILCIGSGLLTLGGCAAANRPDVPSDAMQVSSGDKVVAFTAPHDGKAYLLDESDQRVVYSTELKRDQMMRFDPALDSVQIDGKTAPEGIADPNHDHSIYFSRSAIADRAAAGGNGDNSVSNNSNGIPTVQVPIGIKVDVQTQPSASN